MNDWKRMAAIGLAALPWIVASMNQAGATDLAPPVVFQASGPSVASANTHAARRVARTYAWSSDAIKAAGNPFPLTSAHRIATRSGSMTMTSYRSPLTILAGWLTAASCKPEIVGNGDGNSDC